MLTFFRRILNGLLDMGAARKYLLYAVVEIALVVIGIPTCGRQVDCFAD